MDWQSKKDFTWEKTATYLEDDATAGTNQCVTMAWDFEYESVNM